MKLNTRTWGSGGRIAVLVHGIMSDSRTWRRVGPALAARGYRVIAVDLRGHGASERAEDYAPASYAADIVETTDGLGEIDLAIGHSLGGLALVRAADTLRPARAVYVDPAWHLGARTEDFDPATAFIAFADTATAESVAAANPEWPAEDVEVELATLRLWDRNTARRLPASASAVGIPEKAAVPSLVLLPESSSLVGSQDIEKLASLGFEIRRVPGVGHTVHRDDYEGFMTALEGWV